MSVGCCEMRQSGVVRCLLGVVCQSGVVRCLLGVVRCVSQVL